jgi:hypothetical protein
MAWLVRRQRGLTAILWGGVLAGFLYYVFFRAFFSWQPGSPGAGGLGLLFVWIPNMIMGSFSSVFFAWAASRFFVEIRRSGELELLITTPSGADRIARDQWDLLSNALALPLTISCCGVLIASIFSTLTQFPRPRSDLVVFAFLLGPITSAINLVMCIQALSRVGLWFGLRARGQAGAILWTVALVKGVPYGIAFAWSIFGTLFSLDDWTREFWPLLSIVPAIPTYAFYWWVVRVAKRGVIQELSGTPFSLETIIPFSRARQQVERFRSWKTA